MLIAEVDHEFPHWNFLHDVNFNLWLSSLPTASPNSSANYGEYSYQKVAMAVKAHCCRVRRVEQETS